MWSIIVGSCPFCTTALLLNTTACGSVMVLLAISTGTMKKRACYSLVASYAKSQISYLYFHYDISC